MIVIKDTDFEMEQLKDYPFFDLKLPAIINEGKSNERTEMKIAGYGMTFEECLKQIISKRLNVREKTYSAIEYMKAYTMEVEKIGKLVEYIAKASKTDKQIIIEEDDD